MDAILFIVPYRLIVEEIQKRLGEKHALARDPIFVIRFCVARLFDLTKTIEMLEVNPRAAIIIIQVDGSIYVCLSVRQNHFTWRATNLPIPYSEVYPELKKGKWFVHGHDKAGRPIVFVRGRYFDPTVRRNFIMINIPFPPFVC